MVRKKIVLVLRILGLLYYEVFEFFLADGRCKPTTFLDSHSLQVVGLICFVCSIRVMKFVC